MIIPTIVEYTPRGMMTWDPFSRLLKERIIMLTSPVTDEVASVIQANLIYLESEDPEKDIIMYINSPGGSVSAGLAIYDTMQYVRPDIQTVCVGMAASMAQVLLCAGTEGKRMALPNSRIMMHQPSGGSQGQVADMEIYLKEMLRMQDQPRLVQAGRRRGENRIELAPPAARADIGEGLGYEESQLRVGLDLEPHGQRIGGRRGVVQHDEAERLQAPLADQRRRAGQEDRNDWPNQIEQRNDGEGESEGGEIENHQTPASEAQVLDSDLHRLDPEHFE